VEDERELIPRLVGAVVGARAEQFLGAGWDPRSRSQTARAQALLADLLVYVTNPQQVTSLCRTILMSMQTAVDNVRLPTQYLSMRDSEPARALAIRQFWNAVKLFGNIVSWHQQLSNRALRALAVDKLLQGILLPFLRQWKSIAPLSSSPQQSSRSDYLQLDTFLEVNEKIISLIPQNWLSGNSGENPQGGAGGVANQFGLWHMFIVQSLRSYKKAGEGGDQEWQRARTLLRKLGDTHEANAL
jgi:hypothetical protein